MSFKAMQTVVESGLKDGPLQLSNASEPTLLDSVHKCRNHSC